MPNETITQYSLKRDQIFNGTTPYVTSFDWEIEFKKAPDVFTEGDLLDDVLNSVFKLRTTQWSAPDIPDAQPMTVNIKGHLFTQPGIAPNYGSVSINLQDNSDLTVTKYVTSLEKAMDDPQTHSTRKRNPADMYFDFNIYQLDPMGNRIQLWACRHAVLAAGATNANQGTSDKQIVGNINLRFQVDFYEIAFEGDSNWEAYKNYEK